MPTRKSGKKLKEELYFDNAATTRTSEEAARAVLEVLTEDYGNPSSLHYKGLEAQMRIDKARRQTAELLGCQPERITFTSGATEANNLILFGGAYARRRRGNRIITTAYEHASVLEPCRQLEKEGFEVIWIKPDAAGNIRAEDVIDAVNEDTILVSCMAVNNELGTILPLSKIVKGVRRKKSDVFIHSDAVQALGKLPIRLSRLDLDALSVSAHKIHGPKGVGALYLKEGSRVLPRTFGGEQEKRLRPGTENAACIAGFGAACELMRENGASYMEQVGQCSQHLRSLLAEREGFVIHSPQDALSVILNISVLGVRSEVMLHYLEEKGICVSSGSACSKGAKSHVLSAVGMSDAAMDSALRISFSHENTLEQTEKLAAALLEGQSALCFQRKKGK